MKNQPAVALAPDWLTAKPVRSTIPYAESAAAHPERCAQGQAVMLTSNNMGDFGAIGGMGSITTTASTVDACINSTSYTYWVPPYWWPNYIYATADHRPVKLGLSEIERLRAAAKKDAKLKAILAKFTDLIEVAVDFE